MAEEEALKKYLTEQKRREQEETLTVLESLRRSRKSRGGVGAPLEVPANLKGAAKGMGIVVTDADMDPTQSVDPLVFRERPVTPD